MTKRAFGLAAALWIAGSGVALADPPALPSIPPQIQNNPIVQSVLNAVGNILLQTTNGNTAHGKSNVLPALRSASRNGAERLSRRALAPGNGYQSPWRNDNAGDDRGCERICAERSLTQRRHDHNALGFTGK